MFKYYKNLKKIQLVHNSIQTQINPQNRPITKNSLALISKYHNELKQFTVDIKK